MSQTPRGPWVSVSLVCDSGPRHLGSDETRPVPDSRGSGNPKIDFLSRVCGSRVFLRYRPFRTRRTRRPGDPETRRLLGRQQSQDRQKGEQRHKDRERERGTHTTGDEEVTFVHKGIRSSPYPLLLPPYRVCPGPAERRSHRWLILTSQEGVRSFPERGDPVPCAGTLAGPGPQPIVEMILVHPVHSRQGRALSP